MAEAHRIKSEQEAVEAARLIAEQIRATSGARDRDRRLPFEEVEWFSHSGLWAITVPKEYGGAGVSTPVLTEVVAIISAADASLGQIPQNHYANVEEIRLIGTETQKAFFFSRILKGDRLGNAAVERSGKSVLENKTKLVTDGDGYLLSGEKFYSTGALFAHWVPAFRAASMHPAPRGVHPGATEQLYSQARAPARLAVVDRPKESMANPLHDQRALHGPRPPAQRCARHS